MTGGGITPDGPLLSDDMPPRVLRVPRTPDERFLANFFWRLAWDGDCLIWQGSVGWNGYGRYRAKGVHRVAFTIWHGSIPRGKSVLHQCDRPLCVAPGHLIIGTQHANMQQKIARGRWRGGIRPGCFGEENNAAKVSTEQAQMALDLAESGWWLAAISRRTGIPVGNVRSIVRRRSWGHLSPVAGGYPPPTVLPRRWQRFAPGTKLP